MLKSEYDATPAFEYAYNERTTSVTIWSVRMIVTVPLLVDGTLCHHADFIVQTRTENSVLLAASSII